MQEVLFLQQICVAYPFVKETIINKGSKRTRLAKIYYFFELTFSILLCILLIEVTNPTKIVLIEVTNPTKIVLIDTSNANYQVHPQSLHLKLLFILLEKMPRVPIETARSIASILLTLVEPQVGQRGLLETDEYTCSIS